MKNGSDLLMQLETAFLEKMVKLKADARSIALVRYEVTQRCRQLCILAAEHEVNFDDIRKCKAWNAWGERDMSSRGKTERMMMLLGRK